MLVDSSLAREALGWKPLTGLPEGIAATVEWARGEAASPS
jgi:nucleoside-diphosphate-sugar epimerase